MLSVPNEKYYGEIHLAFCRQQTEAKPWFDKENPNLSAQETGCRELKKRGKTKTQSPLQTQEQRKEVGKKPLICFLKEMECCGESVCRDA